MTELRPDLETIKVTICIAAACAESSENREMRIVLCTDWRVSGFTGSADTMLKQRRLPHNYRLLTAGNDSAILALQNHVFDSMKAVQEADDVTVPKAVRDALNARKRELADEFVQGKYALSLDDFYRYGKERFPDGIFRDAMLRISEIDLGAECIIAGFDTTGFPLLIVTERDGRIRLKEEFATCGEGALLAQSSLLHREQINVRSLDPTIYCVYEAKKAAERVGSVGEMTTIAVLYPNGQAKTLQRNGHDQLKLLYQQLGPKPLDEKMLLQGDLWKEQ